MRLVLVVMASFYPNPVLCFQNGQSRAVPRETATRSSGHKTRRSAPVRGHDVDFCGGSGMLILLPLDVVHELVESRSGGQLVPAQLRRGLGKAGSPPFLEGPLPDPGSIEDGLVVDLAGDLAFAALVPVQELLIQAALGVDLPGVGQEGDEQVLLLVGNGAAPSRCPVCFSGRASWVPTTSIA